MPSPPSDTGNALPARFGQALALHQQGRLAEAAAIYEGILRQRPDHFDALHLLGVVALQTGRAERSAALIARALALKADFAEAHSNHGNALYELGRHEAALAAYDRAIALKPEYAEAHGNRGNVLRELRRYAEALAACEKAIALKPDHAEAHSNRGLILSNLDRHREALASCDRAIALRPDFADAHSNRGNALRALTRYEEALASYDAAVALKSDSAEFRNNRSAALSDLHRYEEALIGCDEAIALKPDHAEAYANRGLVLGKLRRHAEALADCDKAVALKPDYAGAHSNRGVALHNLRRYEEALAAHDTAIALAPHSAEAWNNRGIALGDLGQYQEALASYDAAIARKPDYAEACSNRGNALHDLRRYREALASHDAAIALKPDFAQAYSNRANALEALRRDEEALASYDTAIALMPDYAEGRWNKSLCLLRQGRYAEGWRLYEWRKKCATPIADRSFPQPLWRGQEEISGRTLFVHAEQGLGDTLQFCRYARRVTALGAAVVLAVQEPLLRLLKQMEPEIGVVALGQTPDAFDYHCPLMSLPLALGTTLETIPAEPGYLSADARLRAEWATRLPAGRRPRIGLAWRGNPAHRNDHNRSMPLESWLPLLRDDAEWIALHKEIDDEDAPLLRQNDRIAFIGDRLEDFADTAAVIDTLDLVIAVDTGVAHLAAAMGKPVWILLPHTSDWRWLTDRSDSPWYPSARLFRQRESGNWETVIDEVRHALVDRIEDTHRMEASTRAVEAAQKIYVRSGGGAWVEVALGPARRVEPA